MKKLSLVFLTMIFLMPSAKAINPSAKGNKETVVTDNWYSMQVRQTPWGYYHEVILIKDGKYFYRYDMKKKENNQFYEENLGAIAKDDLTPVAFNLNKKGPNLQESYNATYETKDSVGIFSVTLKGSRFKTSKRHVAKNTILEAFFPVWISKHWNDISNGFRATLPIFTEEPESGEYMVKQAKLQYKGERTVDQITCKDIEVEFDGRRSKWCFQNSTLVEMTIPGNDIVVKKTSSEAAAKKMLPET